MVYQGRGVNSRKANGRHLLMFTHLELSYDGRARIAKMNTWEFLTPSYPNPMILHLSFLASVL